MSLPRWAGSDTVHQNDGETLLTNKPPVKPLDTKIWEQPKDAVKLNLKFSSLELAKSDATNKLQLSPFSGNKSLVTPVNDPMNIHYVKTIIEGESHKRLDSIVEK